MSSRPESAGLARRRGTCRRAATLHDPNGLKVELACYKFETPEGYRAVDVLMKAHTLRVDRGDHHITDEHVADAIEPMYTRSMDPVERMPTPDPVVEAYKKDVDRTLFERNSRLTPSERVEQLQRFVAFLAEVSAAKRRRASEPSDPQAD